MKLLFSCLALAAAAAASAAPRCPPVFGDHMVLQRDLPVAVWGEADPGERVTVEFAGRRAEAVADTAGRWRVTLAPLAASAEPRPLTVRGTEVRTFRDVLVGEVWFCSGQSNMEKPIGPWKHTPPTDDYESVLARSDHPTLRVFQFPRAGVAQPGDGTVAWHPAGPEVLRRTKFSAVAYHFAEELVARLGVPVGVINSSHGSSRIEAWMPPEVFREVPELRGLEREEFLPPVAATQATRLYQSMVAPFAPYTLRGFLWYQGESNCLNAEHELYAVKLRALVAAWRRAWEQPAAPFYYVQLAPFAYSRRENPAIPLTVEALPALWEAQAAALDVPGTGMVVTTDLAGDASDIHPSNKQDVGWRLARLALAETYGRKDSAAHSARFAGVRRIGGNQLEVAFTQGGGLRSRDGGPLTDFAVAGSDRKFHPADAVVAGDKVVVSSPAVAEPVAVRFGWHETARPNLVNGAGLPTAPFRSDRWPVVRAAVP
ncbi:MAG: hypothetical protein JNG83_12320 [Opitutaceae bacterium]|nr:hypothetical protein [Opitutaceae bacterium]